MELIKYLQSDMWMKTSPTNIPGLKLFTIVRSECTADSNCDVPTYRYAVKEVSKSGYEGRLAMVTLTGIRRDFTVDPLLNIRNAEFLIGSDGQLLAINVDGDCVVQTGKLSPPLSING